MFKGCILVIVSFWGRDLEPERSQISDFQPPKQPTPNQPMTFLRNPRYQDGPISIGELAEWWHQYEGNDQNESSTHPQNT